MGDFAWIGLGLMAAAGAAGVAVFGRLGLQQFDAVLGTTLRSLVMSALLLLLCASRGGIGDLLAGRVALGGRAALYVLAAGVCGAASWLAYFAALERGPAGPVSALDRLSLPLVFVLGALLLGESAGARGWAGLALMLAGTALIVWDQTGL